jgi:hypothetical protein
VLESAENRLEFAPLALVTESRAFALSFSPDLSGRDGSVGGTGQFMVDCRDELELAGCEVDENRPKGSGDSGMIDETCEPLRDAVGVSRSRWLTSLSSFP